ncbi:MAG TPA: glycine--tRNA ligase [archaeon]|nr:glycine--tRNA ligase [archaeon]
MEREDLVEKIISLCKRRGIIFPTSEIYGNFAGFFDYGNYGSLMKRNVEDSWIKHFVTGRDDVVLIDGATITHPLVWKASGHVDSFNDPLVECKKCHKRFRADHLVESKLNISVDGLAREQIQELITKHKIVCPECKGEFTVIKMFNLMFKTHVGSTEDDASATYLRPETAQLIFSDFKQIATTSRKKLPFGMAQIGRAFRNEISPRNFVFRSREFTQMEIEFFIHPEKMDKCDLIDKNFELNVLTEDMQEKKQDHKKMKVGEILDKNTIRTKWHTYWIVESLKWLTSIGIREENLRLRQHVKAELSHYSSETWDIEYNYPWGWKELVGIANRGDFDLKQHAKISKEELSYFDEEAKKRMVPHVIEPSFGLDRIILTLLLDAYDEKVEKGETKIVLKLNSKIAPLTVGVFPLMKKDGLDDKARDITESLKNEIICEYDDSGSIGKRYARMDEIGTPWCITVDYDSSRDKKVTIRDRDTTKQKRIKITDVDDVIKSLLAGKTKFDEA